MAALPFPPAKGVSRLLVRVGAARLLLAAPQRSVTDHGSACYLLHVTGPDPRTVTGNRQTHPMLCSPRPRVGRGPPKPTRLDLPATAPMILRLLQPSSNFRRSQLLYNMKTDASSSWRSCRRGRLRAKPPFPLPPEKPADSAIVPFPYEVSASGDIGIPGSRDSRGRRTRTSLDDVANSIDVITAELIQDMGALDLQDIAAYGNNIDAGYISQNENADGALTALWDQNTTYVRGFRTYRGTRNFMFTLMSFQRLQQRPHRPLERSQCRALRRRRTGRRRINYNTKRASSCATAPRFRCERTTKAPSAPSWTSTTP